MALRVSEKWLAKNLGKRAMAQAVTSRRRQTVRAKCDAPEYVSFEVKAAPMGKPRMTRRDRWAKRPAVLAYRAWADLIRAQAPVYAREPRRIHVTAYVGFPKSYSDAKRKALSGAEHQVKPDADNILKGVMDVLFSRDQVIADVKCRKFWDDGAGPRLVIEIWK